MRSRAPHVRRLIVFMLGAVGIHIVLILSITRPPQEPRDALPPELEVILERTTDTTPPEPPKSEHRRGEAAGHTGAPVSKAGPSEPRNAPEPASSESSTPPTVAELLQDVPDGAVDPYKPYTGEPEPHRIFAPGSEIPPSQGTQYLDETIWHRTRVKQHIRHAVLEGRAIWIKHFENGEMQVCEKPHDDPFDHGDDYWPFSCDRPSR